MTTSRPAVIRPKSSANCLPSSMISKHDLKTPQEVIRKYHKLRGECKAGKLSLKLAKEAYFGESLLAKCTVYGCRELPGLPLVDLNELKNTMFLQFGKYWKAVEDFEAIWNACVDSIYWTVCKGPEKSGHLIKTCTCSIYTCTILVCMHPFTLISTCTAINTLTRKVSVCVSVCNGCDSLPQRVLWERDYKSINQYYNAYTGNESPKMWSGRRWSAIATVTGRLRRRDSRHWTK